MDLGAFLDGFWKDLGLIMEVGWVAVFATYRSFEWEFFFALCSVFCALVLSGLARWRFRRSAALWISMDLSLIHI